MSGSITPSSVLTIQNYQQDGMLGSSTSITVAQLAGAVLPEISASSIASAVVSLIASEQSAGLDVTLATLTQGSASTQLFSVLEEYVPLAGNASMGGALFLSGLPSEPLHAAPKGYVDAILNASQAAVSNLQTNIATAQDAASRATTSAATASSFATALTEQTASAVAGIIVGGVPSGAATLIGGGTGGNLFSGIGLAPTLELSGGTLSVVTGQAGGVQGIDTNGNIAVLGTKVQIGTGSGAVTFEAPGDGSVIIHASSFLFGALPTSAPAANASGYLTLWNAGGLAALA